MLHARGGHPLLRPASRKLRFSRAAVTGPREFNRHNHADNGHRTSGLQQTNTVLCHAKFWSVSMTQAQDARAFRIGGETDAAAEIRRSKDFATLDRAGRMVRV